MNNMIIGLGNTGSMIVKSVLSSSLLKDVSLYAIDSVASSVDLEMINRVNIIPIISDEKSGSGRNRERGRAMYEYHEEQGDFAEMYENAINAKSPVIVVTSAAGGTGSGSCVALCKALVSRGVTPVPIIICPNPSDPDAFHLNTNDLFIELSEIEDDEGEPGIKSYSVFQNPKDSADYTPINNEVVNLIEIILGKRYTATERDSIDDSDLDTLLSMPGRFIAVSASSTSVDELRKEIARKVFSGYQPAWTMDEAEKHTFMTGYSLTSMFADKDFDDVFEDIRKRIVNSYDEYRNIAPNDNDGKCDAIAIIAGLPRIQVKDIDNEYVGVGSIGEGIKKSKRPSFIKKKKASIETETTSTNEGSKEVLNKFKWK